MQQQVKFLGYRVSSSGVAVDPDKVAAIQQWPVPTEQRHVRQFLGMANFYRRFISRFSHLAKPLNDLLKTGSGGHTRSSSRAASKAAVQWGSEQQEAFDAIKQALCSPPVLAMYDPDLPCVVTTDASEYAVGGVLEQDTADGRKPVAYASRSLNPAEQNYTVTERENLALVYCLQEWQHMLEGSPHPVRCLTDHAALLSLLTKPVLSRREARWVEELAAFNLRITHIAGSSNAVGDPLSRRPDHEQLVAPAALGAPPGWKLAQQFGLLDQPAAQLAAGAERAASAVAALVGEPAAAAAAGPAAAEAAGPHQAATGQGSGEPTQQQFAPPLVAAAVAVSEDTAFRDAVVAAYQQDPQTADVIRQLKAGGTIPPKGGWRWELGGELLYQVGGGRRRLYLPADTALHTSVMQQFHNEPAAGHRGTSATLHRIRQHYYWAGLSRAVQAYCRTCPTCQGTKASNSKPAGLARPLPVPDRPWQSVSLDLITKLPRSSGHTAIVVFVDRFSKQAHFAPTTTKVSAPQLAELFISTVFKHHGMPADLVSDRDPRFVSDFWSSMCKQLQVKQRLSTANHPQTDGQTERTNRILEEFLRAYVSARQDNWAQLLPIAEFAYNSSVQQSTGMAPFQLVYGSVPDSPADLRAKALQQQQAQQQARQQQAQQQPLGRQRGPNSAAEQLLEQLQTNWHLAKRRIAAAQQRQAEAANKKRADVSFKEGDLVRVSAAHFRTLSGTAKLNKKWLGPFLILKMRGPNAAELELPSTLRAHPVINVGQLKLERSGSYDHGVEQPPDPELVDGEEEYEVEDILEHRIRKYGRSTREEYKVLWKGYPKWEATWEPKAHLAHAPKVLRAYQQRAHSVASLMCWLRAG
jgi:hypothetical protein